MAYDRADWHYGGEYPEELPPENGATHIGMFLAWAINHDLIGELHLEDSTDALQAVKMRKITGRDFLLEQCDEKFWDEDLNDLGNEFAQHYYEGNHYYTDYENILTKELPSLYHVENTWENYDKIAAVITLRFEEWNSSK